MIDDGELDCASNAIRRMILEESCELPFDFRVFLDLGCPGTTDFDAVERAARLIIAKC
ncbi:MAG: hypothetical protein FD172_2508 [Methylocystaceae bacterium]|nr:MAG: hypothetical protein FD172_2508 [Methylocystaceae bacterium]